MGNMVKKLKGGATAPEPEAAGKRYAPVLTSRPAGLGLSGKLLQKKYDQGYRGGEAILDEEAPPAADPNVRPTGQGLASVIAQRLWDRDHANDVYEDPNGYKPGGKSRAMTPEEIAAAKKQRRRQPVALELNDTLG